MKIFLNREEAGQELAVLLKKYAGRSDVIVLALPRGGVPVAYAVAEALQLPLDVLVVRKLGMPGQPELAMGAIASGDVAVLNPDVLRYLDEPQSAVHKVIARERAELERRERVFRQARPALEVAGRVAILVDDGAATGATMRAAIQALRKRGAKEIVVGLPTASDQAGQALREDADKFVCVQTPEPFHSVGQWYRRFDQTSDEEVVELLEKASRASAMRQ